MNCRVETPKQKSRDHQSLTVRLCELGVGAIPARCHALGVKKAGVLRSLRNFP